MPLFKEGKHVTVMKKLINLWPSIKHKNKINIKTILHYHYKKICRDVYGYVGLCRAMWSYVGLCSF